MWLEKRYLCSDDTVGASLDQTLSTYKSENTQTPVKDLLKKASRCPVMIKSTVSLSENVVFCVIRPFTSEVTYTSYKDVG